MVIQEVIPGVVPPVALTGNTTSSTTDNTTGNTTGNTDSITSEGNTKLYLYYVRFLCYWSSTLLLFGHPAPLFHIVLLCLSDVSTGFKYLLRPLRDPTQKWHFLRLCLANFYCLSDLY